MSLGNRLYAELKGDKVIWMILAVLALFSLLLVYSSTGMLAYREKGGNTEFFLLKHFMILSVGLFLTFTIYSMHYMKFKRVAPYLILITVPLLIYTISFGTDLNQARRWIMIPFLDVSFQTSDFAKLALIMYVAREITRKQEYIEDFKSAFLPIIVPVLIVCGLIAPADLSSAVLLFVTCLMMMFIGRVAIKYIALLLFLGLNVFVFLVAISEFYPNFIRTETWITRLNEFVNEKEGGYQITQAKIAIANGKFFGKGPGNSVQRNHLPHGYSDFIYAIINEEYGLLGGFIVMGLYILLLFRSVRLLTISPKAFGSMLAIGLTIGLVTQALANMAVNVNMVPVTGLTLPMLSMGGTSLLFTCIAFGMILSVSKHIEELHNRQEAMMSGNDGVASASPQPAPAN